MHRALASSHDHLPFCTVEKAMHATSRSLRRNRKISFCDAVMREDCPSYDHASILRSKHPGSARREREFLLNYEVRCERLSGVIFNEREISERGELDEVDESSLPQMQSSHAGSNTPLPHVNTSS